MLEIEQQKGHIQIDSNDARYKEFYSRCEKIVNMEKLEKPLDKYMFAELEQAVILVNSLKVNRSQAALN